jgi:hypothetical protein
MASRCKIQLFDEDGDAATEGCKEACVFDTSHLRIEAVNLTARC